MELRHLRYFVVVAEERHITRAALRLGIQQPPLSLQIRQLETELGTSLFTRTARGVVLTAAGQAFLEDARAILASVDRAAARSVQIARGHQGRLSVGFTTSAILHPFVRRVMRAFRETYPAIELDPHEGNAATLTRSVATGTMAAGFLRIPVDRPPGVAFVELLSEELLAVLPIGHALSGGSDALDLSQLAQENFILVRRPGAPGIYENVIAACRAAGFEPSIAAEVPHMLTNVNLVAAGFGISIVPASMREISLHDVQYRRLRATPLLTAPLTMAFLADNDDPILANLSALTRDLAEREGGQVTAAR
ncbi:MAG: LysR family transcriptional regulator [Aliidongia sp.]